MDRIKFKKGDDSMSCGDAFAYAKTLKFSSDLCSFLDELSNVTGNAEKYESIFEYYINHDNLWVKTECMSALMFNIGRDDAYLQTMAWYYIDIREEDEFNPQYSNIKIWSFSCLSRIHFNTQNIEITKKMYSIFSNEVEDTQIRAAAFRSILKIYYGKDTSLYFQKNGKLASTYEDIDFEEFKEELAILKKVFYPHAT